MDPTLDVAKVPNTGAVVAKIETIVESILDALLAKQPLSIPIRMKTPLPSTISSSSPHCRQWREMAVSFPGKTNDESRRFGKDMCRSGHFSECMAEQRAVNREIDMIPV